jgi:polyisoprenoid-binding protein YceI
MTIPGYVTGTWDIDLLHSDVSFVVRHVGLSKYRRSFEKFSGEIIIADNPLDSSVTASVDITSFDTGLELFNRHLLEGRFFDADNHPTATLRSTGVRAVGDDYIVDTELTLRGTTRQVPFSLVHHGFGQGVNGETKTAFSANTTINRHDFGIAFDQRLVDGTLMVGDEVQILLEIEAVLRTP